MRRPTENPHERESPSTTRGDVVRAAWTHTATCVFCLTIFFNDSIQLTNCDEVMSQYFHENGKGRIEKWQPRKRQRRRLQRRAARSTSLIFDRNPRGRASVPFGFSGDFRTALRRPRQRYFVRGADAVIRTARHASRVWLGFEFPGGNLRRVLLHPQLSFLQLLG